MAFALEDNGDTENLSSESFPIPHDGVNSTDKLPVLRSYVHENSLYVIQTDIIDRELEDCPFLEVIDNNPNNWKSQPSVIVFKFQGFETIINDLPENICNSIRALISRTIESKFITPYLNHHKDLPDDIRRGSVPVVIRIENTNDSYFSEKNIVKEIKHKFIDLLEITKQGIISFELNEEIQYQGIKGIYLFKLIIK